MVIGVLGVGGGSRVAGGDFRKVRRYLGSKGEDFSGCR